MTETLSKGVVSLLGAAYCCGLFWCVCYVAGWDVPYWAYFIVGWMGHNDFYDWLTFEKKP